jgi:hypothetical protein
MKLIIFIWCLLNGTIVFQKEVDGRKCYRIEFSETTEIREANQIYYGKTVDYAYKEEIYQYFDTNIFVYDEDLGKGE